MSTSRLEQVEPSPAYRLGRVEREAVAKHRQRCEECLLPARQKVVRPRDRRSERCLPQVGVTAAAQQVEPAAETREKLFRREHAGACRGELQRERQVVEPCADLVDVLVGLEGRIGRARACREERYRVRPLEERRGVDLLGRYTQPFTARHEQSQVRTRLEQLLDLGRRGDHVLEVVEQNEHHAVCDGSGRRAHNPERASDRRDDLRRVGDRRQWHPPHAGGIPVGRGRGSLQAEPRLAAAARARDRQEPRVPDQLGQLGELALAADERRGGDRQIGGVERLQRREILVAELEDPLRR